MERKLILGVGDAMLLRDYGELFDMESSRENCSFRLGYCVSNASRAIDEINTGKYDGLLLTRLNMQIGGNMFHAEKIKEFEKFDHPPGLYFSPGLYVVKHSIDKNLPVFCKYVHE